MPLYKSSKSEKLIEIEPAFDVDPASPTKGKDLAREEALSKGWVPVHKMVSKSGKTINVTDDALPEAMKKGWETEQVAQAKKAPIGVSKTESALRGAAQSMTLGAADEISSALIAPFSDKTYDGLAGDYRKVDKAAFDENPVSMIAGGIVAGLPIGGGAGSSLSQLAKQGAALGGVTGWNSGEGLKDRAIQAVGGATVGAAAPYAMKGIGKVAEKAGDKAVDSYQYLKGAIGEGRKAAAASNSGALMKPIDFAEGAFGAVKQARGLQSEIDNLQNAVKIGSGKTLPQTPDDPLLTLDLFEPGASPTKDFIASKSGTLGGNMDTEMLRSALEMGPDRRIAARSFDKKAAAKEITPLVDQLHDEFQQARNQGYSALQDRARQSFQPADDDLGMIFDKGRGLLNRDPMTGKPLKKMSVIPAKNQGEIETALELLDNGNKNVGGVGENLTETKFWNASPAEQFDRLQLAREIIDEQRDYFAANGMGRAERKMVEFRGVIDKALKGAPGKQEADELFSKGKSLEDKLFGATEFRGKDGRTDVDEFKIDKLFNNTDNAGRFGNAIQEMRDFLDNPNINKETADKIKGLLDRFDQNRSTAADARLLETLRQKQGPSSPAILLQAKLLNKAKLPSEAVFDPAGFINSSDQFLREYATKAYNTPYASLDGAQKRKLLKLFVWQKNNPKATQAELQQAANKLLGEP